MKYSVLLFIVSNCLFAQQSYIDNFKINEDDNIYYQKIFTPDTLINPTDFVKFLKTKPFIYDIETLDNSINFSINEMLIDYRKYGGNYMSTLIILNHIMFGNATIDFKENRYRLTIINIKFIDNISVYAVQSGNDRTNTSYLEDYVYNKRKKEIKTNNVTTKGLFYLDSFLSDFFKFKPANNKDW